MNEPPPEVVQLVEALLFIGHEPLDLSAIGATVPEVDEQAYLQAIQVLRRRYRSQRRPYLIQKTDKGYKLELTPQFAQTLKDRSHTERGAKLNRQTVEALAVIAYRQPITKEELREQIGSDPSAILRQLTRRELVALDPNTWEKSESRAYITTARFLDVFGLDNLNDLPATEDLQQL